MSSSEKSPLPRHMHNVDEELFLFNNTQRQHRSTFLANGILDKCFGVMRFNERVGSKPEAAPTADELEGNAFLRVGVANTVKRGEDELAGECTQLIVRFEIPTFPSGGMPVPRQRGVHLGDESIDESLSVSIGRFSQHDLNVYLDLRNGLIFARDHGIFPNLKDNLFDINDPRQHRA